SPSSRHLPVLASFPTRRSSDLRFGDKYKQWNAAFDAGFCAALGKPYVTLHAEDIIHPLKEVDASAQAWATTPEQIVEILRYTLKDRKSTRLNSSHVKISYAVFC